jgi:hypothetical protein
MPQPQDPHAHEEVVPIPNVGDAAPTLGKDIGFPHDKPVLVVFLRHCGDPFAEKTFRLLTDLSNHHSEVHCVAVSQSSQEETDKWCVTVTDVNQMNMAADKGSGSSKQAASGMFRLLSTPSASCITLGVWG